MAFSDVGTGNQLHAEKMRWFRIVMSNPIERLKDFKSLCLTLMDRGRPTWTWASFWSTFATTNWTTCSRFCLVLKATLQIVAGPPRTYHHDSMTSSVCQQGNIWFIVCSEIIFILFKGKQSHSKATLCTKQCCSKASSGGKWVMLLKDRKQPLSIMQASPCPAPAFQCFGIQTLKHVQELLEKQLKVYVNLIVQNSV